MLSVVVLVCLGLASCQAALYPYGSGNGDSSLSLCDDCSSSPISTSANIQLGDSEYNRLWINANGHVTFHAPVSTYRPLSLPMTGNSWKTVAPFWADVNLRVTSVAPDARLYHRQTTDQGILDTAEAEIRAQFSDNFYLYSPSWAYIVTWHRVTYYGSPNLGGGLRNTFQAVIVTDGSTSFSIFNYGDMSWSRGTASGNIHAVAGFDANDGHHAMVSGSLTSAMATISGTRILKIGGDDSAASNCHTETGRQLCLTQGRFGNTMEGFAQIKIDGVWHSICSRGWGNDDATVFCTQLGYPGQAQRIRNAGDVFGELSEPLDYAMERLNCVGDEECLVNCTYHQPSSRCGPGNEAGVICNGAPVNTRPIRLAGGADNSQGNVEIDMVSHWSKVCDVGWGVEDATLLCQELGYAAGIPTRNSFFDSTDGLGYEFSRFRCEMTHESFFACPSDDDIDATSCGDNDAAGAICYTAEQDIRLVKPEGDSTDTREGNVEFKIGSQYRRVCDIGFGEHEAALVCEGLDLGTDGIEVFRNAEFGDTNNHLPFFHFNCDGSANEEKLFDCLKPLNGDVCDGGEVVGIRCPPAPE